MMAGGQSINDRLQAARYSLAGQGLAKSVCKATTEEVIGPKKKHLDYLLHCTNEPNVSIPQLANLLIERSSNASWVVVFKALVTVHHLMCYGNERFTQYLASSNCSFQLSNFVDKTNVQGYDMSTFIRRYAKYLNEKALSYRTIAFDFCKVKRGKDDGILRTMNVDKLIKTLPVLQNQVDALLEFDCTANELTNGVINAAFMLLFRDLIRLFACYNDGIINLLEKYFEMNKKMCRDGLDIYKKFLIRMDRVSEFLKVAESMGLEIGEMRDMMKENVGIDKSDIPDLAKAPGSLLDALEQHLLTLEGKKGSGAATPTQPTAKPPYLKHAVTALSNTSSSFGSAAASGRLELNGLSMDENLKKLALEEEQAALNQHRDRRMKELAASSPTGPPSGSAATNPFLTSPSAEPVIDLFDPIPQSTTTKMSDDLLCLKSNPFADSIMNSGQPTNAAPSAAFQNNFWGAQNGFSAGSTATSAASSNAFVSEYSFAAAFGNESNTNSTSGTSSLMPAPAPEITVDDDGGRHELDIPGLNPFANISSATPSPSGAPEIVRGAGTTPILGGPEGSMFGAHFGEVNSIEPQKTGDEMEKRSPARPPPPVIAPASDLFPDFDSGFGGGSGGTTTESQISRPITPVSTSGSGGAPAKSAADLFGDIGGNFAFGSPVTASTQPVPQQQPQPPMGFGGGQFDFGGGMGSVLPPSTVTGFRTSATSSPSVSGVPSPARSAPTSSAFDDLNASIRAAMSGSPSRNVSAAVTPSAASDGGRSDMGFDSFGDILQPVGSVPSTQSSAQPDQRKLSAGRVITGDLDSSLAILAQNLDINRGVVSMQKGGHVWNSPKNTAKTGGANWAPQIASSTAAWNSPQHGFKAPMSGVSGAPVGAKPADWSSGMTVGAFPSGAPVMGQQPMMGGVARPMGPVMGVGVGSMGMGQPMVQPMGQPMGAVPLQQPMFSAMPQMTHQQQPPMGFGGAPPNTQPSGTTLDPFGAL